MSQIQYEEFESRMDTIRQADPASRREALRALSGQLKALSQAGGLDAGGFPPGAWNACQWILRDWEAYYYEVMREPICVSVILPVYNAQRYLEQCLQSLCDQSLREIEIICVNDGSTDHSAQILHRFAFQDSRIRIIEQENQGAGAARNAGIRAASGKYLFFPDADDYFDPQLLSELYKKAEGEHADICICRAYFHDEETGELSECSYSVRERQLPADGVFSRKEVESNLFTSIVGWAWDKLFRRSFVLNQGLAFQEQRTTNDMYFVYASLLKAERITVLDQYLYYQRRHVSGSLSSSREESWDCFYHALCKVHDELVQMGIYAEYERDFVNYALHSCLWNFNSLKEPAAKAVFDQLTEDWFASLGIAGREEAYFDNPGEYAQYRDLIALDRSDPDAYLQYRINYWQQRYRYEAAHDAMSIEIAFAADEKMTVREMAERLAWNRKERSRLSAVDAENARLRKALAEERAKNNAEAIALNAPVPTGGGESIPVQSLLQELLDTRQEAKQLAAGNRALQAALDRTEAYYKRRQAEHDGAVSKQEEDAGRSAAPDAQTQKAPAGQPQTAEAKITELSKKAAAAEAKVTELSEKAAAAEAKVTKLSEKAAAAEKERDKLAAEKKAAESESRRQRALYEDARYHLEETRKSRSYRLALKLSRLIHRRKGE